MKSSGIRKPCMAAGLSLLVFANLVDRPVSAAQDGPDGLSHDNPAPVRLTIQRAVELALSAEGNYQVRLAAETLRLAEARSDQTRAALLPNVDASASEQSLTRNLAAFGIRFRIPVAGFESPSFVGPFRVYDLRATASQSILDLAAIRRWQAARAGVSEAEAENTETDDRVRELVIRAYFSAVRAEVRRDTAKANVALAEALLRLASDQKEAGTGTGMEVTRAKVQLAGDRQRLLVTENERTRARLELMKLINLGFDSELELVDPLLFEPVEPVTVEGALQKALASRADWQAQLRREESARLQASAVNMERLPSVHAFADYGTIGSNLDDMLPTRTFGLSVRIPLFDGGRRDSRRAESAVQYRAERIRTAELRTRIELEIRLALGRLLATTERVKVAEEALALAQAELEQARRRFGAGVAPGLELTDSQTRLERAQEDRTEALYQHSQARVDLAAATGDTRSFLK